MGAAIIEEFEAEQPMSPAGRMFHTKGFNCFVIAVIGMSTEVDVELVKLGLTQTLLKHPRFSSIMVCVLSY